MSFPMSRLEISPDEFRRAALRMVELASELLAETHSLPAFPRTSGAETERLFRSALPEAGLGTSALDILPEVIRHSRPPTSRFYGYVLGSGEPVAAAADLLASVLNQNVTAWRSSPAAVTIERTVVEWLAQAIGCDGFTGSLTGGGSSANLMGLAMAREAKVPANEHGAQPCVVYASDEVHMSIGKAMALLGVGRENLRLISSDENFRMSPLELERAIHEDRRAGKRALAVVATAGTVNTGAIDPLPQIAEIARHHGLWLHVDGAYGALAAIAAPEKFAGLNQGDSLSLDPHKWLYQPLDCGCLLFRDAQVARTAFAYTGEYTRALNQDPVEAFSFFEESMELSRRFRALKLWLSLRYHGQAAFREAIAADLSHAQRLAAAVDSTPQLERLAPVELSAVCFRFLGESKDEGQRGRLNQAILRRVIERGWVYISNASIRGKFALRACFVNHRTADGDVDAVVPEVLAAAAEVQ
ncbi:MAG TPA: pyridoxal-dependent decarboxylase [Terriglobales bacterium]|nr:pyridoxal-dependent decarboxylase [Terriglobales bacterium]